ncbi:hypothetical protein C0J52_11988 [Blattella germanica]|nr:hypothetical protein C0J52_11988 [Blattella germanica]
MQNYGMRLVLNETEAQRIFITTGTHTLKYLYMCTIGSMNNIKSVFNFVPRSVQHVHWYCSSCVKETG